jgi:hypothetical protein
MTIETQRIETGTANSQNVTDARQKLSDEFGASVHQKAQTTSDSKSLQDKSTSASVASDGTKTASNAEQSKTLPNLSIVHDGTKTETVNPVSNDDRNKLEDLRTQYKGAVVNRDSAAADVAAQHIKDETQKQIQQISQAKLALDKSLNDIAKKAAAETNPDEKTALAAQLDAQKKQEDDIDQQLKTDRSSIAWLSYCQGFQHMATRNMAQANKDFKAIAEIDPELARRFNENPPGGIPKLDEMIKDSEEPSW